MCEGTNSTRTKQNHETFSGFSDYVDLPGCAYADGARLGPCRSRCLGRLFPWLSNNAAPVGNFLGVGGREHSTSILMFNKKPRWLMTSSGITPNTFSNGITGETVNSKFQNLARILRTEISDGVRGHFESSLRAKLDSTTSALAIRIRKPVSTTQSA